MSRVSDVLAYAASQVGKPYVYGDEGPSTFDCSGLVQYVFGLVGVQMPRTAAAQQRATTRVTKPLPGDLVFWGDPAYHVGIYVGGGQIIAAPEPGDRVKIQGVWGHPSGYGRVSGLGTAVGAVMAPVSWAGDAAGAAAGAVLGSLKPLVLQGVFVVAGVGLVGVGLVRAVRGRQG